MENIDILRTHIKKTIKEGKIPLAFTVIKMDSLTRSLGKNYIYYIKRSYQFSKTLERRGKLLFCYALMILTQAGKLKDKEIILKIPGNKQEELLRLILSIPVFMELLEMQRKKEITNEIATALYFDVICNNGNNETMKILQSIGKDYKNEGVEDRINQLLKLFSKNKITVKYGNNLKVEVIK